MVTQPPTTSALATSVTTVLLVTTAQLARPQLPSSHAQQVPTTTESTCTTLSTAFLALRVSSARLVPQPPTDSWSSVLLANFVSLAPPPVPLIFSAQPVLTLHTVEPCPSKIACHVHQATTVCRLLPTRDRLVPLVITVHLALSMKISTHAHRVLTAQALAWPMSTSARHAVLATTAPATECSHRSSALMVITMITMSTLIIVICVQLATSACNQMIIQCHVTKVTTQQEVQPTAQDAHLVTTAQSREHLRLPCCLTSAQLVLSAQPLQSTVQLCQLEVLVLTRTRRVRLMVEMHALSTSTALKALMLRLTLPLMVMRRFSFRVLAMLVKAS